MGFRARRKILTFPTFVSDVTLVSIIVPNFNHRRFLPDRFMSIFGQTYRNCEIIFLDDGSTDDSVNYVRSLKSPFPLRILVNEVNGGSVFRQWDRGIAEAHGELVWIAESDDSASFDFLERLERSTREHPTTGFVYSQSRIISESGEILEETPSYLREIHPTRWSHDYFSKGGDEVANYLALRNTIPNASACVFRRSVFAKVNLAEMSLRLCGDWLAYATILANADIAFVAKPLNYFRRHVGSVRVQSDRSDQRLRETYVVQKFIEEHFSLVPEMKEMACRFSFREWRYLQQSTNAPLQSPKLLATAKRFDPLIEERFERPTEQQLPCAVLRRRGWNTLWRWREEWQAYRDDQQVLLSFGPLRGEVQIDPISKRGEAIIEQVAFFDFDSRRSLEHFAGRELVRCLNPHADLVAWDVSDAGIFIRRGERPAYLQVLIPASLQKKRGAMQITLRAKLPRSWCSEGELVG
jgi:glycosyltransferase involved in cell wall biosynthesis